MVTSPILCALAPAQRAWHCGQTEQLDGKARRSAQSRTMPSPETFVSELEGKNQASFERLIADLERLIEAEDLSLVALLKLEARHTLEATEAAALWASDTDNLAYKMALAANCGACAQRFALIENRLAALGLAAQEFDPVALGYSKLFGHLRSLQTIEERSSAGPLTAGAYALFRYRLIAARAEAQADRETHQLFSLSLPPTEEEAIHAARAALLSNARNEESQARARRAAFRTIELLGELQESGLIKKFLQRSQRRAL